MSEKYYIMYTDRMLEGVRYIIVHTILLDNKRGYGRYGERNMIYKDPQIEINEKYDAHARRSGLYEDETYGWDKIGEGSVRWDSYNEDYVSDFDWELYECLVGNE